MTAVNPFQAPGRWFRGNTHSHSTESDGRLSIRYKGVELAYRTFDKLRQVSQAEIVENKRLGAVLAFIREQQIARAEPRSKKAPRRRDQSDARLFKVG